MPGKVTTYYYLQTEGTGGTARTYVEVSLVTSHTMAVAAAMVELGLRPVGCQMMESSL